MTQPTNRSLYFIIGGGGKVGYYLAKKLLENEHEVVLLEKDSRRVAELRSELGDAVEQGDACEARTLERVGCERADYLLAVTGDDEDNLVMSQVAKVGFPGKERRTIARVNNVDNIDLFKKLGIDVVISPTRSILAAIATELPMGTMVEITPTTNTGLQMIELRVPNDSPVKNQPLRALTLPKGTNIVLVIRGDQTLAPDTNTMVQVDDKIFAVVTPEGKDRLCRSILGVNG